MCGGEYYKQGEGLSNKVATNRAHGIEFSELC